MGRSTPTYLWQPHLATTMLQQKRGKNKIDTLLLKTPNSILCPLQDRCPCPEISLKISLLPKLGDVDTRKAYSHNKTPRDGKRRYNHYI